MKNNANNTTSTSDKNLLQETTRKLEKFYVCPYCGHRARDNYWNYCGKCGEGVVE
jgi:rubrerythrin